MRQLLKLHPDSHCVATPRVEVQVVRPRADGLVLSYIVIGKTSDVRMSSAVKAERSDELWQHTCFEIFIRASSGNLYYELNFAPSTQWAAYRFSNYRSGMCVAKEISTPAIEVRLSPDCYTLQASLELDNLILPRDASWHLGLSAIIEEMSGCKSYWALAHPPGKPDFHHADCFAYELSPAILP